MKVLRAFSGDTTGLEDRFELIMSDLEYVENKISEFRVNASLDEDLDLIDDLLITFRGTFRLTQDPMPAPPCLQKTTHEQRTFSYFQCFLSQVLMRSSTGFEEESGQFIYNEIFQKVKEECDRLIETGLKELETDFLEVRYYGTNSEILKRLKVELNSKATAESVIHEPSLCHRPSRGSLLSEVFEPDEPMLGKHKFRLPSQDFDEVPVLTKISSANKGSKRSSSILLDLICIIQEINIIYLQTVNVIIDSQKSNIGKLAVYNMLVASRLTSVGKVPPIHSGNQFKF
jgi:hypothetical protein